MQVCNESVTDLSNLPGSNIPVGTVETLYGQTMRNLKWELPNGGLLVAKKCVSGSQFSHLLVTAFRLQDLCFCIWQHDYIKASTVRIQGEGVCQKTFQSFGAGSRFVTQSLINYSLLPGTVLALIHLCSIVYQILGKLTKFRSYFVDKMSHAYSKFEDHPVPFGLVEQPCTNCHWITGLRKQR